MNHWGEAASVLVWQQLWIEMSMLVCVCKSITTESHPLPENQQKLSPKLSTPLLMPSLIFLSLWLWPAGWHKQRLASLADHPASVTSAVISLPSLNRALMGAWCNVCPPFSCRTGSYCCRLENLIRVTEIKLLAKANVLNWRHSRS